MKNLDQLAIRQDADGVVIPVKVVPGSSRDRIAGVLGDCLKITTTAAPEKGKANAAVAMCPPMLLRGRPQADLPSSPKGERS